MGSFSYAMDWEEDIDTLDAPGGGGGAAGVGPGGMMGGPEYGRDAHGDDVEMGTMDEERRHKLASMASSGSAGGGVLDGEHEARRRAL